MSIRDCSFRFEFWTYIIISEDLLWFVHLAALGFRILGRGGMDGFAEGIRAFVDAFALEDFVEGIEEDFAVQGEGEVLLIAKIIGDTLTIGETVATENLRKAGHAGADAHAELLGFLGEDDELFRKPGAGADEGHIADEHVDELRQLIQRGGAHEFSDPGGALLVWQELAIGIRLIGHGAEFDDAEGSAAAADALLLEDGIAALEDNEQQGQQEEQGADAEQADEGDAEVQRAFEPVGIQGAAACEVTRGERRCLVELGLVQYGINHKD